MRNRIKATAGKATPGVDCPSLKRKVVRPPRPKIANSRALTIDEARSALAAFFEADARYRKALELLNAWNDLDLATTPPEVAKYIGEWQSRAPAAVVTKRRKRQARYHRVQGTIDLYHSTRWEARDRLIRCILWLNRKLESGGTPLMDLDHDELPCALELDGRLLVVHLDDENDGRFVMLTIVDCSTAFARA